MAQQARVSSQPPLPQEAYQYAGMYQLGNPVAVYRVSFRNSIVLGILCLPFVVLFGYVALTDESSSVSIVFMLLLALLCVVGAVYYRWARKTPPFRAGDRSAPAALLTRYAI
jgi:hypothetical protein